jgi:phosphoglycolate phosphatase-like HAD superfamily hydrolase
VLVLFDIDGTLLQGAHQVHRDALHAALHEVHGVDVSRAGRVEAAGRTDGAIARDILLGAGISATRIDERSDAVRDVTCREYARRCPPDMSGFVAPGVPELLAGMAGSEGPLLALVTGNFEPIARLKLDRAGLGRHFARGQGAFGSDSEDRAELPPIARRRAGANGRSYPRERTVVVGDTPRDIACARADGVRCVAVATGPFPAEELRAADAVAADARELGVLLARLIAHA